MFVACVPVKKLNTKTIVVCRVVFITARYPTCVCVRSRHAIFRLGR